MPPLTVRYLPDLKDALITVLECYSGDDELVTVKWMVEAGCPVHGRAMYALCRREENVDKVLSTIELMTFLDSYG